MPNIIKDGVVLADDWIIVADKDIEDVSQLPADGKLILPLQVWQKLNAGLMERITGIWLDSDEAPAPIQEVCKALPLIAINFPAFADGRGYSYANVLRIQYGYEGELRAIGDVLKDQLSYMKRVGFNSFDMRDDQNLEQALNHFADFSKPYQAAVDNDKPLFAQR